MMGGFQINHNSVRTYPNLTFVSCVSLLQILMSVHGILMIVVALGLVRTLWVVTHVSVIQAFVVTGVLVNVSISTNPNLLCMFL